MSELNFTEIASNVTSSMVPFRSTAGLTNIKSRGISILVVGDGQITAEVEIFVRPDFLTVTDEFIQTTIQLNNERTKTVFFETVYDLIRCKVVSLDGTITFIGWKTLK